MADRGFLPGSTSRMQAAISMVRLFMRDFAHLNRVIAGEESSSRMIAWAILDTVDDYNTTPPLISPVTVESFPSLSMLRQGATIRLLQSVAILGARNYINFSDGGVSVSFTANIPLIHNMIQMLSSEYEQKKLRHKTAVNISQGWGAGVHSDYYIVNSWYGAF